MAAKYTNEDVYLEEASIQLVSCDTLTIFIFRILYSFQIEEAEAEAKGSGAEESVKFYTHLLYTQCNFILISEQEPVKKKKKN